MLIFFYVQVPLQASGLSVVVKSESLPGSAILSGTSNTHNTNTNSNKGTLKNFVILAKYDKLAGLTQNLRSSYFFPKAISVGRNEIPYSQLYFLGGNGNENCFT